MDWNNKIKPLEHSRRPYFPVSVEGKRPQPPELFFTFFPISFFSVAMIILGFPGGLVVKNPAYNVGDAGDVGPVCVQKIPWRRKWQPSPILFPGEAHGQRSLAGFRPQGHKESDTTGHARDYHPHYRPVTTLNVFFCLVNSMKLDLCFGFCSVPIGQNSV